MKHRRAISSVVVAPVLLAAAFVAPSVFMVSARAATFYYTGSKSTEAVMTFHHSVEIRSARKPSQKAARAAIIKQVDHLFGPMAEASKKAVPKGDHEISAISVSAGAESGVFLAEYDYRGTIVLEKGPRAKYRVALPNDPETIYRAGFVGRKNPCTDAHYQDEGDFWYFWNPENAGCKLVEGRDYTMVEATIERLANQKKTYPEYDRLVENGDINVVLLMGMDEPAKARDPNTSTDVNAKNFRAVKKALLAAGYESRVWTAADIGAVTGKKARKNPYVEEFTLTLKRARIVMRVFFGPTGIDEESTAFHYFFKDAIENASVMMYDGHSGLGGHLDLAAIEQERGFRFAPSKDRYQIYFFNSCSSYTYYNSMFFDRKQTPSDEEGTKNLDILTNGLATYFEVMHDTNLALLKAIEAWADRGTRQTYQSLAKKIDSDNLFGINGDQDNP